MREFLRLALPSFIRGLLWSSPPWAMGARGPYTRPIGILFWGAAWPPHPFGTAAFRPGTPFPVLRRECCVIVLFT